MKIQGLELERYGSQVEYSTVQYSTVQYSKVEPTGVDTPPV